MISVAYIRVELDKKQCWSSVQSQTGLLLKLIGERGFSALTYFYASSRKMPAGRISMPNKQDFAVAGKRPPPEPRGSSLELVKNRHGAGGLQSCEKMHGDPHSILTFPAADLSAVGIA